MHSTFEAEQSTEVTQLLFASLLVTQTLFRQKGTVPLTIWHWRSVSHGVRHTPSMQLRPAAH